MSIRQGNGIDATSNYLKNTVLPQITQLRSSNIFDNELTDLAGFPACTITIEESPARYLDNARNEHRWKFVIRFFIDRNKQNFGASKTEQILRQMSDSLMLILDADPTLGGNVIATYPPQVKYGYLNRESTNMRMAEVTVEAWDAITWR